MAQHLQEFFSNFNSSEGKWVQSIDTQNTFDCYFEFEPPMLDETKKEEKKGLGAMLGKLAGGALGAAQNAVKNTLNSVTGGLASSLLGDYPSVEDERNKFDKSTSNTFLEYLCHANLVPTVPGEKSLGEQFMDKSAWVGGASSTIASPLVLSLGPYIQKITLPNLEVPVDSVKTIFGEFPVTEIYVKPDNNQIMMDILNTKVPLHERIFYPWMHETTHPFWTYADHPYTTAKVTIDMTKHADVKYVLYGVRPMRINTYDPSQELPSSFARPVTFIFDWMIVTSSLTTHQDWKDKLLDAGKALLGGVGKML